MSDSIKSLAKRIVSEMVPCPNTLDLATRCWCCMVFAPDVSEHHRVHYRVAAAFRLGGYDAVMGLGRKDGSPLPPGHYGD